MTSRSISLTDPRALRALAHPTRLALLGLLRREGPQTATTAARLIGESTGSCSFHLRQLRKYGLVEETGDGTGRRKPWRATADYTSWPSVTADAELAEASELLTTVIAERHVEELLDWVHRRANESEEWQRAAAANDGFVYLTPDELTDLNERIWSLFTAYDARRDDPGLRPAGARPVHHIEITFPMTQPPAADGSDERAEQ